MPRYFLMYFLGFWVPSFFLFPYVWMNIDKAMKKAFVVTFFAVIIPCSILVEHVYLWADVWNFSQAWDPLLGVDLWGAPIEEYVFWVGASVAVQLVYLTLDILDKKYFRKKTHA